MEEKFMNTPTKEKMVAELKDIYGALTGILAETAVMRDENIRPSHHNGVHNCSILSPFSSIYEMAGGV